MTYRGHVKNGQITLDEAARLPEGAEVQVAVVETQPEPANSAPAQPGQPTIWDKLLKLAGTVEGLPPDMAENHDHYLYGTPKRK